MMSTKKPIIVEICGMPGAGKSTICHRMVEMHTDAQFGYRVSVLGNWFTFIYEVLKLFPMYIRLGFSGLFVFRLVKLTRLKVLYKIINSQRHLSRKPIIFDQGPLYYQVFLLAIGSSFSPKECLKSWIARDISNWSKMLKGIIWLDAGEEMLLKRVCQRNQEHSLKTRTDAERREFIEGYRFAYSSVISMYERAGIPVLRISTEENDIDMTKDRIEQFLSELKSGCISGDDCLRAVC